jgi:hypothetical protein
MSTTPSPSEAEIKKKAEQESRKTDLGKEISNIGKTLGPINSPEASELVMELDKIKRSLILLEPNGGQSSEYALSHLQNQLHEITEKANQESQKFLLMGEISTIKEQMNSIGGPESASAIRKIDYQIRILRSIPSDGSETSFSKLTIAQNEIDELRKQTDSISRKAQQEAQKLSLLGDLARLKESLISIKEFDLSPILEKVDDRKRKLESLTPNGSDLSAYALSSLQNEIDTLSQEAKTTIEEGKNKANTAQKTWRESFRWLSPLFAWTAKIPLQMWLVIIPAAATIAVALIQNASQEKIAATPTPSVQPSITGTANAGEDSINVSFSNPRSNNASVQIQIKDGEHPNDDPIVNVVIPPGGAIPQDLAPGNYQIEARPIYPEITPQSANCRIEWQPSDTYKGDIVITSSTTMFTISQFHLEPREICSTETPAPPSPTPG